MISEGGSYIKKNGKLDRVEQTKWPEEKDALVKTPPAAEADPSAAKGAGKGNPGNKEA
ncbi:hypothetical protein [Shinella sp. M31]|uniref:hypothetical protein n=1 Tax=Shinella sp. M31 TaxID=3368615 RepID=UPI003B9FF887